MVEALQNITPSLKGHGVVFLILANSNMDDKLYQELLRLSRRKKIYIFVITDKAEYDLPVLNNVVLQDVDGKKINLSLSKKNKEKYKKDFFLRQEEFEKKCRDLAIRVIVVKLEENLFDRMLEISK